MIKPVGTRLPRILAPGGLDPLGSVRGPIARGILLASSACAWVGFGFVGTGRALPPPPPVFHAFASQPVAEISTGDSAQEGPAEQEPSPRGLAQGGPAPQELGPPLLAPPRTAVPAPLPEVIAADPEVPAEGAGAAQADGHWWSPLVAQPQRPANPSVPLTLDRLAWETVRCSEQLQALRLEPEIRETQIVQADADFDPTAFIDARWYDRDEPVGNFLATGGKPRLLEETFTDNLGFRKRTRRGGTFEISQQLALQESNSEFFIPNNQAQTRMAISLTQPLLRGAGCAVNRSMIVLAQHETRIAWDLFAEGLQDRLLEVARQYWRLFYQRSLVLQKGKNLHRAISIREELEGRQAIDTLRSQLERAKAKVATRQAELVRARAGVRNAEARLRGLVNSPLLESQADLEILPVDLPAAVLVPIELPVARQLALDQRPEIDNLLEQIQAASVRLNVARNQVLPALNLILDTYVNGLVGNYQLGRSYGDQFSVGAPSYTAGLVFEVPLGNRRARAAQRQRLLELSKLTSELRSATATLGAEVEIALREVEAKYAELQSHQVSLVATRAEVEYLVQRWWNLPGDDQSASFLLENVMDAEDRLVFQEQLMTAAQTDYAIAQVELKRQLGMLMVSAACHRAGAVDPVAGQGIEPGVEQVAADHQVPMPEPTTPPAPPTLFAPPASR